MGAFASFIITPPPPFFPLDTTSPRRLFPMETKPNASAQPHPFMDAAYDITTVDYNADRYKVREYADVASLAASTPRDWATVRWVNVEGINDDVLRELQVSGCVGVCTRGGGGGRNAEAEPSVTTAIAGDPFATALA